MIGAPGVFFYIVFMPALQNTLWLDPDMAILLSTRTRQVTIPNSFLNWVDLKTLLYNIILHNHNDIQHYSSIDGEQTVTCEDDQYILDAAEEAGIDMNYSCRELVLLVLVIL